MTKAKKLSIYIYVTHEVYIGKHTVDECCAEIEKHLRYVLEDTINPIPPTKLIRQIKVQYVDTNHNNINFDYVGRRDAIKASELAKSIRNKEEKRKTYQFKHPVWLCIFLPFPENRHPYEIEYDNEYSRVTFTEMLNQSSYERIYVTSEIDGIDIKRIK